MLQMYTDSQTGVSVNAGDAIVFQTKNMQTNGTSTSTAGTTQTSLNVPGIYVVHFDGVFAGDADTTATIGLYVNGAQYISGSTSVTFSAADTKVAVGFETSVYVGAQCPYVDFAKVLTVVTDTDVTLYHANILVTRL